MSFDDSSFFKRIFFGNFNKIAKEFFLMKKKFFAFRTEKNIENFKI